MWFAMLTYKPDVFCQHGCDLQCLHISRMFPVNMDVDAMLTYKPDVSCQHGCSLQCLHISRMFPVNMDVVCNAYI